MPSPFSFDRLARGRSQAVLCVGCAIRTFFRQKAQQQNAQKAPTIRAYLCQYSQLTFALSYGIILL